MKPNLICDKEKKIRDLVNIPWNQSRLFEDKVKWNKLCVSLDTIEDTQIAINDYFELTEKDSKKGGYLVLYGLLQSFYLQQDAVIHLYEALFNKTTDLKRDHPDLYFVRELRNDAIGHPTKRGNDSSFHYIGRKSVTTDSLRLISRYPKSNKTEFRDFDIKEIKMKQEKDVNKILDNVIEVMEKEYNNHKRKFKNSTLSGLIPDSMGYMIGKVYEGIYNNYPLAEMNFSIIKETIETIKNEIIKRYGSISALQGIEDVLRRIDYIVQRVEKWIQDSELYKNFDAEVFLDSFYDRFKELEVMLKEIDEEFSKIN